MTEAKYTMLVFTQFNPRAKSIQVQMDNIVTPSLSDQNGGTQSNILSQLGNGILGLFTEKRDHGYYWASLRDTEEENRFPVMWKAQLSWI